MKNAVQARTARAVLVATLSATLVAFSPVDAVAATSEGPVATIGFKSAGGTGCPGTDTVKPSWSPKENLLTLLYDQMQAVDPTPATMSRDCTVTLEVSYPENYQFAITNTIFHGYYLLSKGARAEAGALVQWQGDKTPQVLKTSYFDTPGRQNFTFDQPVNELRYSKCGEPTILVLNMYVQATHADDGGAALISMGYSETVTGDPLSGKPIVQSLDFTSQSC